MESGRPATPVVVQLFPGACHRHLVSAAAVCLPVARPAAWPRGPGDGVDDCAVGEPVASAAAPDPPAFETSARLGRQRNCRNEEVVHACNGNRIHRVGRPRELCADYGLQ